MSSVWDLRAPVRSIHHCHLVPCSQLEAFLALGWMVVNHYRAFGNNEESFIMEWRCACPLVVPKSKISIDPSDKRG